jgi:radical SAM protein with 4Fe4S-binding SPASM domain
MLSPYLYEVWENRKKMKAINRKIEDIYVIPSSQENRYIIYSPLRGMSFFANPKAMEIINNYLITGEDIPKEHLKLHEHFRKLEAMKISVPKEYKLKDCLGNHAVFLLSQKCNLACSYCYAKDDRSQDTLDRDRIKTVVDYILSVPSDKIKSFSFMGGGEPTVTWDLFTWSVGYIKNAADNQKIHIGLTTNATLLDKKRILWLKQNEIRVGISFDILPEVQNTQRAFPNPAKNSFDIVDRNIKSLINNGFSVHVRATITNGNVMLMPEMVQYVIEHYPQIKRLHLEQVTDAEQNSAGFYGKYITYFFKAKQLGMTKGIDIYNSIVNSLNGIRTRFCEGELCITPNGEIVSCHRISSRENKKFNDFCYGLVRDKMQISETDLQRIDSIVKPPECSICFARWHCAGGCSANRLLCSAEQLSCNCSFTKSMIVQALENKLNNV